MKKKTEYFQGREREFSFLKEFVEEDRAGFTFVRGRRRVGKSWLLKEFQKRSAGFCFYFSGVADETADQVLRRFVDEWCTATKQNTLREIHQDYLSWKRLFAEVTRFASQQKKQTVIIFDEIQWLAKGFSGFVGAVKEAWLDWEKLNNLKIIACGSSNKFFHEQTYGDEKILRGLKTRAAIWVESFSIAEIKKFFLPSWSQEEICLVYMFTGGVPYYLSQLDASLGFVHAINEAFFLNKSIFLDEVDEVLGLEFNKRGVETVKKILSVLGQDGTTQKFIQQKTGLSAACVSETLEKLTDYNLVFAKVPAHTKPVKNGAGVSYFMKDFFLNFYFQILLPLRQRISENVKGLLFPYACLATKMGFYIPDFSGKAFELLMRFVFEKPILSENAAIFTKMQLLDHDYEVATYWDQSTQVDLIVEHARDRISRIVECKWVTGSVDLNALVTEVLSKKYTPPVGFSRKYFLCLSQKVSRTLKEKAFQQGVVIIGLEDLF